MKNIIMSCMVFFNQKLWMADPNNEKEKNLKRGYVEKGVVKLSLGLESRKGHLNPSHVPLKHISRNFIHHPENTVNLKYSNSELEELYR